MAKSPDCKIQSACQTQRLNKRRDCQQIRLLPGIQVGSGIPERAASSGIKRSCCKIQRMHTIWRMPMSFKTIFCISQLFYNSPFKTTCYRNSWSIAVIMPPHQRVLHPLQRPSHRYVHRYYQYQSGDIGHFPCPAPSCK